jgi:hypothetical protein
LATAPPDQLALLINFKVAAPPEVVHCALLDLDEGAQIVDSLLPALFRVSATGQDEGALV